MLRRSALRLWLLVLPLLLFSGGVAVADTLIVALGSSSTAGKGVGPAETYPAQLESMLNAIGEHVRVIDAGINGDTSAGMLARLDRDVPPGTRLVILQAGTNDAGDDDHGENIAAIIDQLRARSVKVVLFRTSLMRDLRSRYAQADGHHLTAEGYQILATRLMPLVERALRKEQ